MYLRKTKRLQRETSLYEPIGTDKDGNELTLVDLYGTDPEEIEEAANLAWEREKLYQHLPQLEAREREVICKRFGIPDGEERTQREIAIELGISRSYVSRIERKALDKLYGQLRQGS
jgi:RNA polymerase sporulation-specific sigma factor